jgi:predicted RNA-binding protein YlxR (DUF448 family)
MRLSATNNGVVRVSFMAANKTAQGPRPRHIPQRMCIACRRTDAKRGLLRLVRTTDGHVVLDRTGKLNGRGAYLCHEPACWDQALKRKGLERALRVTTLLPEDRTTLEQFADGLVAEATTNMTTESDYGSS